MSEAILVRVKRLHADALLPHYAHLGETGDLAADLYSVEEMVLSSGETKAVSTGIAIALPPGFGAVVEDRSGLATKGISTVGGIIDTGYRGELKVLLTNMSNENFTITKSARIAQLRIVRRIEANFEEVEELAATERNHSGFGSTGT
jgi:dUTP pyrophosphatase